MIETSENKKTYYEENKYRICYNTLNKYCYKSIETIHKKCPKDVENYIKRYPFENYAENSIKWELRRRKIYSSQGLHDDCYDAGMMAYMYSIHRCAVMNYSHTEAYIKKMIHIYITCAIVVYHESRNLCKVNGFREIKLDAEYSRDSY